MSPDFLCLPDSMSVDHVLDQVRASKAPPEALAVVFATDGEGRVSGTASVVRILKAPTGSRLADVIRPDPAHVHADWDLHAVVRKMSDFNLTVAPVLDEDHRTLMGVVTVDDVLELLVPSGWRRDFGMAQAEE